MLQISSKFGSYDFTIQRCAKYQAGHLPVSKSSSTEAIRDQYHIIVYDCIFIVVVVDVPQVVQRSVSIVAHTRHRSPSFIFIVDLKIVDP